MQPMGGGTEEGSEKAVEEKGYGSKLYLPSHHSKAPIACGRQSGETIINEWPECFYHFDLQQLVLSRRAASGDSSLTRCRMPSLELASYPPIYSLARAEKALLLLHRNVTESTYHLSFFPVSRRAMT